MEDKILFVHNLFYHKSLITTLLFVKNRTIDVKLLTSAVRLHTSDIIVFSHNTGSVNNRQIVN